MTRMATRISMLAAVALALLASSAAAAGLKVSPAGGGAFPARSLVLSAPFLPSSFAPKVHVEENGRPVAGVNASAVTRSDRGNFGVVLAIDTSASMRGRAIVRALAAARALAAQRTGEQQLGVIEFNNAVRVPLPPTTDQRAIDRALAGRVPLGAGTHIYDAVDAGVALLQRAGIAAGSVIVLSDGSDHGSGKTPAEVAAAAQAAHVRIFTVGLRSRSFDPQTLRALAAGGGGDFAEADSSQLPRIFTQLGARLASEYLVHYRSVQARGRRIDVSVRVDGVPGVWHGSYSSPPPLAAVLPRRPAEKSFWTSAAALALVAVGCALLVGLAVAVFLSGRRSGNRVRARVAEFISPATAESAGGDTAAPPRVVGRLERSLERRPWWTT
ncbi:MAG: von Willebrand factor type domain, partial [Solirubrobacteraceae bacterium]|nr:von Willebrand factor type domain [Solirubrobacteraceae bacterium]